MTEDQARILSHVSNSGIVQMPGRRFPGIVIQGDSVSNLFDAVVVGLREAKTRRDEDTYYELLTSAEVLQSQLLHYEETLGQLGMDLPYANSIKERLVHDDFDA